MVRRAAGLITASVQLVGIVFEEMLCLSVRRFCVSICESIIVCLFPGRCLAFQSIVDVTGHAFSDEGMLFVVALEFALGKG